MSNLKSNKENIKKLYAFASSDKFLKLADKVHNAKNLKERELHISAIQKLVKPEFISADLFRGNCIRICHKIPFPKHITCIYICKPPVTRNPN